MDTRTYIIVFFAVILILLTVWLVNDFAVVLVEPRSTKLIWSTKFFTFDVKRWSIIANDNQINKLNYPSQVAPEVKDNNLNLQVINKNITYDGENYPFQSSKITSNSQFLQGIFIVKAKLNDIINKNFAVYLQSYVNLCNNITLEDAIYIFKTKNNSVVAGIKTNYIQYPNISYDQYHTFTVVWNNQSVSWYIDSDIGVSGVLGGGIKIGTINFTGDVSKKLFNNPMHLSLEIQANSQTQKSESVEFADIKIYQLKK